MLHNKLLIANPEEENSSEDNSSMSLEEKSSHLDISNIIIFDEEDDDLEINYDAVRDKIVKLDDLLHIIPEFNHSTSYNFKNISLFWLLAFMLPRSSEVLAELMLKFKDQIQFKHLLEAPQEGNEKGRSILCLFAENIDEAPELFINAWKHFEEEFTFEILTTPLTRSGPEEKTILSIFLPHLTDNEIFNQLWNKFRNQFKLKHFHSHSNNNGPSLLFSLAYTAAKGEINKFAIIWEHFREELVSLYPQFAHKDMKNLDVISAWILTESAISHPNLFAIHWSDHGNKLSIEQLTSIIPSGPHQGKSLLWFLPSLLAEKTFNPIWEKVKNQLTLEHLKAYPLQGPTQGKSLLWLLAALFSKLRYKHFMEIFLRFKTELCTSDFTTVPSNGHPSVLDHLLVGFHIPQLTSVTAGLLIKMLNHYPDLFSVDSLQQNCRIKINGQSLTYQDLINSCQLTAERKKINDIIAASIPFFAKMKEAKSAQGKPDKDTLRKLFELAVTATMDGQGYVEAFYDLALWLHSFSDYDLQVLACQAFNQVPVSSWQFQRGNEIAADILFGVALTVSQISRSDRTSYLENAFAFALRGNREFKQDIIPKILQALLYPNAKIDCHGLAGITAEVINSLNMSECLKGHVSTKTCLAMLVAVHQATLKDPHFLELHQLQQESTTAPGDYVLPEATSPLLLFTPAVTERSFEEIAMSKDEPKDKRTQLSPR